MKLIQPTLRDIKRAAKCIRPYTIVTPLLESGFLNEQIQGRLLLKVESLQRTGSFKFRGAFNAISQIPVSKREHGVVAYSSGNHAQGVAAAAQLLNLPAVIVMPEDAPTIKINNTRRYGAEVVLYDRDRDNREKIGKEIALSRSATLIKPYDDVNVISGQGTIGVEIVGQAQSMGAVLNSMLIPCGGGGLSSGIATALSELNPFCSVYSVEPEGFDDTARSLRLGHCVSNKVTSASICDSLLAPTPGELTFSLNKNLLAGGFAVTDKETMNAVRVAFNFFKLVLEPGGAVALAAVLSHKIETKNKTICVVCSGGNVDSDLFIRIITGN